MQKVCDLLIIKLKIIEDNIKNNEKNIKISDENTLVIDFENENYTTIGMVNYLLQCSEKNVEYSGITMYDGFLQNNIRLRLKTKKGISPFLELYKSINNSVNILGLESSDNIIYPTYESIKSGTYPLDRFLLIYVKVKLLKENQESLREYIEFILSSTGQEAMASTSEHYIPLNSSEINCELNKIKSL